MSGGLSYISTCDHACKHSAEGFTTHRASRPGLPGTRSYRRDVVPFSNGFSKPLLPPHIDPHERWRYAHDEQRSEEEQAFGQRRLERQGLAEEVHAEEADQKRHRHEHDGDHRQRLHDVVGAVRHDREVGLERAGDEVAQTLGDVMNPHHMVVDIAKVDPVLGLDRLVGVSCQAIEHLALGAEDLLQADGRTLQAEDRFEGLRARVRDHLVLDRVHPVVEVFDGFERLVHGPLQKADEQMIRAMLEPVARVALDRLAVLVEERQGFGMIGDHVIEAEEDVELMQPQHIGSGIDRRSMEDEVDVVSPIVDLGDM